MDGIDPCDIDVLRRLAGQKTAAASSTVNAQRREAWYRHNGRGRTRPLVLVEIQGVLDETVPESVLECRGDLARCLEGGCGRSCTSTRWSTTTT